MCLRSCLGTCVACAWISFARNRSINISKLGIIIIKTRLNNILLPLVLLASVGSVVASDGGIMLDGLETESNNEPATADALIEGQPLIGSLYSYQDIDVYSLELTGPIDLSLHLKKMDRDLNGIAYAMFDAEEIAYAAGTLYGEDDKTKRVGIVAPGTYYLAIFGTGAFNTSDGEYEITFSTSEYSGLLETEPNGSEDKSNLLSTETTMVGHLAGYNDFDFYKLPIKGGSALTLTVSKEGDSIFDSIRYAIGNDASGVLAAGTLSNDEPEIKRIGVGDDGIYYLVLTGNGSLSTSYEEYLVRADYETLSLSDSDSDGVLDEIDNCPDVTNANQVDTDSDHLGDVCDTDDDGDDVPDEEDAYPLISLDGRTDTDGDGYPDDCDSSCIEIGMSADLDDDNDGIVDSTDNCLLTPNADQLNTDSDAEGNVCDLDDDNDGYTDVEELADGTDPLNRFSCRSGCFSFDIDQDEEAKALTDGLLVIRHLFGFSGDSLITGATSGSGQRTSPEEITGLLDDASSELDIDGDGEEKALTDGLLLIRYLFGFTGESLTTGAIGSGASRTTSEEIEAYISERIPAQD